jgi:hypothetical protein
MENNADKQQRNYELQQLAETCGFNLWRLCDELTVRQAIMLYFGYNPEDGNAYEDLDFHGLVKPMEQAIFHGFDSGAIKGTAAYYDNEAANSWTSTIDVESFKSWLRGRGLESKFFFPEGTKETPDYLNKKHSRYAPKLAAAINAWLAVGEPTKGKTPKQSLTKWLNEHAAEYEFEVPSFFRSPSSLNHAALSCPSELLTHLSKN